MRAINPKGIAGSFQIMYRLDSRISRKSEKISIEGRDITGFMNLFYLHKLTLNSKLHAARKKERANPNKLIFNFFFHIDYRYPDNLLRLSRVL